MNNTIKQEILLNSSDYKFDFWDKIIRGKHFDEDKYKVLNVDDMQMLPYESKNKYMKALIKENFFRQIATTVEASFGETSVWTMNENQIAEWTPENEEIKNDTPKEDFSKHRFEKKKVALLTKLGVEFANDGGFDVEKYLTKHFAKCFSRAEEQAFILGSSEDEPTGILNDTEGANVGVETSGITYDDVAKLFLTTDAEYRKNGVWLMNDRTALVLRKLKDENGNYIWNHNNDTIFGKQVFTSEFMPEIESGKKPIAFGDFSYYMIVNRFPIAARPLVEKFALSQDIGYIACEYLDAKLLNPDAIKVLQITSNEV